MGEFSRTNCNKAMQINKIKIEYNKNKMKVYH